jgi:thioredoxin 1
MRRRILLLTALVSALAGAATLPYDETADARAAITQALSSAKTQQRAVLVVFGANWCEDCRVLDQALKSGRNADLISREFEVVKVDVGRFNRNLELSKAYGDPIRKGIPAAVVLSADERVLYSTKAGELSNARRMSETGIYDFFETVVQTSKSQQ